MEPKQNYLLVGIFVLVAVGLLSLFVIWLSRSDDKRDYETYHTYFTDSVTGLTNGASVKYRGVEVGKVRSIEIDKNDATRILVSMRIVEGTPITADTVAQLKILGITGLAYVELQGSSKNSPPLVTKKGETPVIPSIPSPLTQLVNSIPEILDRFSKVTLQLSRLMSEENVDHISTTLTNIEKFSASFGNNAGDVETALANMGKAMDQLAATSKTVNDIANESQDDIRTTLKETRVAMEQLSELLKGTNQFSAGGYREMSLLLAEIKRATREIRDLTKGLKEDPSQVVIPEKPGGVKIP